MANLLCISSSVSDKVHIFIFSSDFPNQSNHEEVGQTISMCAGDDHTFIGGVRENSLCKISDSDVENMSIEIKSLPSSAVCNINSSDSEKNKIQLDFLNKLQKIIISKSGDIQLFTNETTCNYLIHLNGLDLLPESCSSLKTTNASIECRLSIAASAVPEKNMDLKRSSSFVERFCKDIVDVEKMLCSFCSQAIADTEGIYEVTDLHDDGMQDSSISHFCHGGELADNSARSVSENQCQFNGTELVLPSGSIIKSSLAIGGRSLVFCSRCQYPLGRRTLMGQTSFFSCNLNIHKSVKDIDGDTVGHTTLPLLGNHEYLSLLLKTVCEGYSAKRLVILAVNDAESYECALIWFLEGRSKFYQYRINDTSAVDTKIVIDPVDVSRLMFLPFCDDSFSTILNVWSKDVSVNNLILPESLALQLVNLMLKSSEMLPPSLRKVNQFFCAFTPCPE